MSTLIEKLRNRHKEWSLNTNYWMDDKLILDVFNDVIEIVKQHSEWISVDERLPDSDCYVIVYCDGGNVTKSFFTTDREYLRLSRNSRYTRKAYGKNSGYFAISHDDGYKVTHWMPIPNPPSEVQP